MKARGRLPVPPAGYLQRAAAVALLDADLRERWCWTAQPAATGSSPTTARVPWDVDARTGSSPTPPAATRWRRRNTGAAIGAHPTSPTRDYQFPPTSGAPLAAIPPTWSLAQRPPGHESVRRQRCTTGLCHLGFTEQTWNAQTYNSESIRRGDPVVASLRPARSGSRNNATMAKLSDGTSVSMFLWEPAAASFYALRDRRLRHVGDRPRYTHMIENRLIGKGNTRSGFHAGAMGRVGRTSSDSVPHQYGLPRLTRGRSLLRHRQSVPGIRTTTWPSVRRPSPAGRMDQHAQFRIHGPRHHRPAGAFGQPDLSAVNHDLRKLFLSATRTGRHGARVRRRRPAVEQCRATGGGSSCVRRDALMPTAPPCWTRDAYCRGSAALRRRQPHLLWLGFARRGFGERQRGRASGHRPGASFESPRHEPPRRTLWR